MPLTSKGEKIMKNMQEEYGPKKGKEVFYASANKGTIAGVHDVTEPKPATGPMSTSGPVGRSEGLPKTAQQSEALHAQGSAPDRARDTVGKSMSLDEIKTNAKRIGRY